MICEEKFYAQVVDKLNKILDKFIQDNPTKDYFKHYSIFLYPGYNYNIYSEVFSTAPCDAVSHVYARDGGIRFILRVWKNRKKLMNYLDNNFNLKKIEDYQKDFRGTYYVLETKDINLLYTMLCLYTD